MKRSMLLAVLSGCLLIGSLYPRLLLDRHVKLVDETGMERIMEEDYRKEIPVKLEFRILKFFH